MSKKIHYLVLFFCFKIFFCDATFSQKKTKIINDFESWSSIGLTYKPIKKMTLGLGQNIRLKKNSSLVDKYFTQFNVGYKLVKKIEIGIGYRLVRTQETESNLVDLYESSKRINFDLTYKNSIKRFNYSFRTRYQNKKDNNTTETIRLKTKIQYNIKKWKLDPEVAGEIFYRPSETFKNYRVTLSTGLEIDKASKLKIFVLFEKELNEQFPKSTYVAGLAFTHKLKF